MSLTSLLKQPSVRDRFVKAFGNHRHKVPLPLVAQPRSHNYGGVGTAFDYLLRFHVEYLNRRGPKVITTHPWVARSALRKLELEPKAKEIKEAIKRAKGILANAERNRNQYLQTGQITPKLFRSAMQLSQLDTYFRSGYLDPWALGEVNPIDVKDLKALFLAIPNKQFRAESYCILNPTFGDGSMFIGGADADLLIDGTLIEIKTTKQDHLERRAFHQLIGYYALHRIYRCDGMPLRAQITHLSIYFSRHGYLYSIPVRDIGVPKEFPKFLRWFKTRVECGVDAF